MFASRGDFGKPNLVHFPSQEKRFQKIARGSHNRLLPNASFAVPILFAVKNTGHTVEDSGRYPLRMARLRHFVCPYIKQAQVQTRPSKNKGLSTLTDGSAA